MIGRAVGNMSNPVPAPRRPNSDGRRGDRSAKSSASAVPPSTSLTVAASQIPWAASLPRRSLDRAGDGQTAMVVIPDPPPSDIRAGSDGNG